MLKNPRCTLAALVAVAALGWLGSSPGRLDSANAQTANLWNVYYSLGDSYSALVPGADSKGPCQRSTAAWPDDAAEIMAASLTNIACSGAHTYDLYRTYRGQSSQIATAVSAHPEIVTITIGGNDLDFGGTMRHCFLLDCSSQKWFRLKLGQVEALRPKLVALFSRLRSALPGAQIVAVGYPYLFPPTHAGTKRCGWLEPVEQTNLNRLTAAVDNVEAAAAHEAKVKYVSVLDVLSGHELCTPQSWVYPIGKWPIGLDGHVYYPGQYAIAYRVLKHIG